jgi:hypothetical protein
LAASFALSVESRIDIDNYRTGRRGGIAQSANIVPLAPVKNLRFEDFKNAQIAWAYFEKNTQAATGLVNSANGYPSTTIWDQASYLLALISAERIGVVSQDQFDKRMKQVLETLAELPLFDGKLPNKVYDTRTLKMTDYANVPMPRGIGWSALDVARISVPLNIILFDYPSHSGRAAMIFRKWNFRSMVRNGALYGSRFAKDTGLVELIQEGRLGYEEYAARAIGLLGLDALEAAKYDDFLRFEKIGGQSIAIDNRNFTDFDAHTVVVSEPYILTAIEFGLDTQARELAQRVYLAQFARYQATGRLTAVSEDNIDQAPYFLYNSVYADGKKWSALAEDGSEHEDKKTVSTKAAFGWDALYGTDYTGRLVRHVGATITENNGFNSGVYEKDNRVNAVATANTNGIILETILYRLQGPLITSRFLTAQGDEE